MNLIGNVVKMDMDANGKASGAFLHAQVAIEIDKPVRRGVLRMSRTNNHVGFRLSMKSFCITALRVE